MRFGTVCLLVLALLTAPLFVGCGSGGSGGKKSEPSAAVKTMPGAPLPGGPGAPPKK